MMMSTISLRRNEEEEKLIKEYAKAHNISLTALVRSSVLERIEDDIGMDLYQQAMKEHEEQPEDISFEAIAQALDTPL